MAFGYPNDKYSPPDPWLNMVGGILQGVGGGLGNALNAYGQQQALRRQAEQQDAQRQFMLHLEQMKEGAGLQRALIGAGARTGAAQITADAANERSIREEGGRNTRSRTRLEEEEKRANVLQAKAVHEAYMRLIDPTAVRSFDPDEEALIKQGLDNGDREAIVRGWAKLLDESGVAARKNLREKNAIKREGHKAAMTMQEWLDRKLAEKQVDAAAAGNKEAATASPFDLKKDPDVMAFVRRHSSRLLQAAGKAARNHGQLDPADAEFFKTEAQRAAAARFPDDEDRQRDLYEAILDRAQAHVDEQ